MGRLTEALDYVGQRYMPTGRDRWKYKHIDLNDPVYERIRKERVKVQRVFEAAVDKIRGRT